MMISVVVVLSLAALCTARRFSPAMADLSPQEAPAENFYQPTSLAFQDYQSTMSEAEAKEILGEKMLSDLEEIGVKEVLRENGLEHISESDAERIVTTAEQMVGDQINDGTQLMVGGNEAQDILSVYDEKLQEIGAEKVLSAAASIGSVVSDGASQSILDEVESQAERFASPQKEMIQKSSSQSNHLQKKIPDNFESEHATNLVSKKAQDQEWEKVLDTFEHPHASSLDKKKAQDREWEKVLDSFEHPSASNLARKKAEDREVEKVVGNSLVDGSGHKSSTHRELVRETPRKTAVKPKETHREGPLQRAKHQLAHIMHMDGSHSHPHHTEAPTSVSQPQMSKQWSHADGNDENKMPFSIGVDSVQPTSLVFQDYQSTMSEAEAKEILGEKMLSDLEEIGVKEVLRENGLEHISESDAERIVTAAEQMVGDQIDDGTKLMVGGKQAQDILSVYDEKLQEIGAEKVLSAAASIGSVVSDGASQSIPDEVESQAERFASPQTEMIQKSSSQTNNLQKKIPDNFESGHATNLVSKKAQDQEWEKVLDTFEHPHASSLDKKKAQDREWEKVLDTYEHPHAYNPDRKKAQDREGEKVVGNSLVDGSGHKSSTHRELVREMPRTAGKSKETHREGLLQRAKHQLAHIMHMDGSHSHPHHTETPTSDSQPKMLKESGHDGDGHGFGKTFDDFSEIVHKIGSEKSKELYLELLNSLADHHTQKGSQISAVDSGVRGGTLDMMAPGPAPAPMLLPSFFQVEQSVHKANGTSNVVGDRKIGHTRDAVNMSSESEALSGHNGVVTSKVVSDKMNEHAVNGVYESDAALSASSTAHAMDENEKIVNSSTVMAKAIANASHENDVAATSKSSVAKSKNKSERISHDANTTLQAATDGMSAHAVSDGGDFADKSANSDANSETMGKAEKRFNKSIQMHHISVPEATHAEPHA